MALILPTSSSMSGSSVETLDTLDFLNFAAELRVKVYRLLLVLDRPIDMDGDRACCRCPAAVTKSTTRPCVEILACCRLIRAEALPYLYAHNTFRVRIDEGHVRAFHRSEFASAVKCSLISTIMLYNDFWVNDARVLMNRTRVIEFKKMPNLSRVILRFSQGSARVMIDQAGEKIVQPVKVCDGIKLLKKNRPDVACMLLIEDFTPSMHPLEMPFEGRTQTLFRISVTDDTVNMHKEKELVCNNEADILLGYTMA